MKKTDITTQLNQLNQYINNKQNNNNIIDSLSLNNTKQILEQSVVKNLIQNQQYQFEQLEYQLNIDKIEDKKTKIQNHLLNQINLNINHQHQIKQKQLHQEILLLNDDLCLLQNHLNIVNSKYQQKIKQNHTYLYNFIQINQKYLRLQQSYENLSNTFKQKQLSITNNYYQQIQQNNIIHINLQNKSKSTINQLQKKILSLQSFITHLQKQYNLIKQLLNSQIIYKKNKQKQTIQQYEYFKNQIHSQKIFIFNLRQQLSSKNQQILSYEEKISLLQKSLQQINKKHTQKETTSKKQLMKQKILTKKAIDSLQITKKYTEIELNKSRKKQKSYLNSQKQLINKIKSICKDKSTLNISSTSTRKTLQKSLNTSLKQTKKDKKHMSPLISKFRQDDQISLQLSPIIHKDQSLKTSVSRFYDLSKEINCMHSYKSVPQIQHMKRKIQIPIFTYVDPCSAGTPCFQIENNNKMFKATK